MIYIDISNCFWRCMQFCILASDIGKWFQNSGSPVGMQKKHTFKIGCDKNVFHINLSEFSVHNTQRER